MASSAGVSSTATAPKIPGGVPALRAGQGTSFLLRRLHSLSGIVPVGAFLVEHMVSNAFATNGPDPYGDQVKFLTGIPFVVWVEALFIWIPIAFHALYGIYIWWRGESNVADYPWVGNWMYTAQRYTGILAFAYIGWHTYTMRFTGAHLIGNAHLAFPKVQAELQNPWALAFYVVGIVAASWHFAYGVWLFAAKWGLIAGERARRRLGVVCFVVGAALIAIGVLTLKAFFNPLWQDEWHKLPEHAQLLWQAAQRILA